MQNNDFYNDPETLKFVTETQHELEKFKKKIRLSALDEILSKKNNQAKTSDIKESSEQATDDKVKKITEIFEKREQYNKDVEKATKKVYSENYRKPPKKYQYKKNQSGNYNGRPPKKPSFTIYEAIQKSFYKEIETTNKGKIEKKALLELFAESIVRDAIKKDGQSRRMLLQDMNLMKHNFMEPLITEAVENIPNKIDKKLDEKLKKKLFEALAKLVEDEDLE